MNKTKAKLWKKEKSGNDKTKPRKNNSLRYLAMFMYVVLMIFGVVISFIPLLGTIAYYIMILAFMSWMGLSFMAMLNDNKEVTDAFGEGWKLMRKFFGKVCFQTL